MKAIVIGGSGATGREVVKQLLEDNRFEKVIALVRRPFFKPHTKLDEVIIDFEKFSEYKNHIQGDVAFSCLGTTLKDAGSKKAQWKVDHDYQYEFAKIAKENGVENFVLMSAYGANATSAIFYNKMKGTLENNIQHLNFSQYVILHPGGIERPNTTRSGEKIMLKTLRALNSIGIMKGYEPMRTDQLAKALIASFFKFKDRKKIVTMKEIKELVQSE